MNNQARMFAILFVTVLLAMAISLASAGDDSDSRSYLPHIVVADEPTPTATVTTTPTLIPTAVPTSIPTAAPTSAPVATSTSAPPAGCTVCASNVYNCSDFPSQSQAQSCFNHCMIQVGYDVHRLDRDGNGLACESLP